MKLYIVRHGESRDNASKTHQFSDNPLSPKGAEQAKSLAERFEQIKDFELIVSSPFERAKQTALEIANITGKEITYSDLAIERLQSSELKGLSYKTEESIRVGELVKQNKHNPDWHYSDEENFYDLVERAKRLIKYLEGINKNLLLVTHGHFLRVVIGYMMFGEEFTHREHTAMELFMRTINTGITICETDDKGVWKLLTWNDHAHLG